ncbi:MAG: NAD-dependent epimerase/dehydratase family protein [Sphingomicrobium sp.]
MTGVTGFIGSRLLENIADETVEIRALARRSMRPRRGVTWVQGALDNSDALSALVEGCDAIIHIAGLINGRTAGEFDEVNVGGTAALVAAARAAGVRRFVHISSLAAREPEISLYGASKAKSEAVVRASGLEYAIVRPPAVYGPGDKETLELFRMAKLGLVLLPAKGRISLIHVDDLVRLMWALCGRDAPSNMTIEPDDGRPGGLTHREFAKQLGEALGRRNLVINIPAAILRSGAVVDQFVRGRRAKLTSDRAAYFAHSDWTADPSLGVPPALWQPSTPAEVGLRATARWYRDHGWL